MQLCRDARQRLVHADDLRDLADYLSTLGVAGCDVVILDPSPRLLLRAATAHAALGGAPRGRPPRAPHASAARSISLRAAAALAACEKVIVAAEDVRYTPAAIEQLCDLLEMHEVVEPQDYLEPLPWWGAIEAGRMLIHRGIEPHPDHGATYGFRRTIVRGMRGLEIADGEDQVAPPRRGGAEVLSGVRRLRPPRVRARFQRLAARASAAGRRRLRAAGQDRRSSSRSSPLADCSSALFGGWSLAGGLRRRNRLRVRAASLCAAALGAARSSRCALACSRRSGCASAR